MLCLPPPPHRDENRVEKGDVCQIKQEVLQSKVSQTYIEDSTQLKEIASKDSKFINSKDFTNSKDFIKSQDSINCKDLIDLAYQKDCKNSKSTQKDSQKPKDLTSKYPPLLNPETFYYHKVPANIAYYYNMPLPHYYKFIYMATYGAGYQAMIKFFRYCGICVAELWTGAPEPQNEYENFYSTLVANKDKYCMIYLSGRGLYGREKLFALIDSKVPLLIIMRDPISIYKPIVNHLGMRDYQYECDLKTDYRVFLDSIRYMIDPYKPSLEYLYNEDNYGRKGAAAISIKSRMQALKNVSEVKYIAFSQILETQAFDTFNMLAKHYGFSPPRARNIFLAKVNGGLLLGLLPRILKLHESDIKSMFRWQSKECFDITLNQKANFSGKDSKSQNEVQNKDSKNTINKHPQHTILITTPQIQGQEDIPKGFIDIGKEPDFNVPFPNIYLLIEKNSYQKLQNNPELFAATKQYLKGFLQELENRANLENNKRLCERDILEKFKSDSVLAMKYKEMFDNELEHLKEHRPDIVKSFKYYQEFEEICKNFDK